MATGTICDLITTLTGQDGPGRKRARDQLVEIVAAAVPSLLPLLSNKQRYARCIWLGVVAGPLRRENIYKIYAESFPWNGSPAPHPGGSTGHCQ